MSQDLEALFARLRARLMTLVVQTSVPELEREDVAHDALIKLSRHASKREIPQHAERRMCSRAIEWVRISRKRKRQREDEHRAGTGGVDVESLAGLHAARPEEPQIARQHLHYVCQAIDEAPPRYAQVLSRMPLTDADRARLIAARFQEAQGRPPSGSLEDEAALHQARNVLYRDVHGARMWLQEKLAEWGVYL